LENVEISQKIKNKTILSEEKLQVVFNKKKVSEK
jgi:hypothetical protein